MLYKLKIISHFFNDSLNKLFMFLFHRGSKVLPELYLIQQNGKLSVTKPGPGKTDLRQPQGDG